jgi:pimeloyl-ACP methyl ester carboxylesterase
MNRAIRTFALAAALVLAATGPGVEAKEKGRRTRPLVIEEQGSFLVGGSVVTNPGTFDLVNPTPAGQTIHGDHAYVQYQIPPRARRLPLVLWHGGGQFSKTWETTPDGREGFQSIFLRRSWSVYILDQPRRGRAGRGTVGTTIAPVPGPGVTGEQAIFVRFRLGLWPDYFPNVSFPRDAASLDQWWRQQTPNTGPESQTVVTDAVAALFQKIGPAVLVTHSASGVLGWLTAIKHRNVRAIVSYEPTTFVFPEGEVPPPIGSTAGQTVPPADFERLTRIPIQIVYGDNIPSSPHPIFNLEVWRERAAMAALFAETVNRHGGDAEVLHLPEVGVRGNTHFPMSDLNNLEVADLLSRYLHQKRLDRR